MSQPDQSHLPENANGHIWKRINVPYFEDGFTKVVCDSCCMVHSKTAALCPCPNPRPQGPWIVSGPYYRECGHLHRAYSAAIKCERKRNRTWRNLCHIHSASCNSRITGRSEAPCNCRKPAEIAHVPEPAIELVLPEEKKEHPAFITTTSGMSGFFAVMLTWEECEDGGFYEPWTTGIGRYATVEEAADEAKMWAEEEGIEYKEAKC